MSARRRLGLEALRRCARGGATVEMALVFPVLAAFLFGTFEIGWAMHCGATVRSAVEHAARPLLSNATTSAATIQAAAQADLNGVPVKNLQVTLTNENLSGGSVVLVSWQYTYDTMLPFVPTTAFRFDSSTIVPVD